MGRIGASFNNGAMLFETPAVTEYRLAEGFLRERFTSRADLAACLLQQAGSDQYLRRPATAPVVDSILQSMRVVLSTGTKELTCTSDW
jgi:hypothetical protein